MIADGEQAFIAPVEDRPDQGFLVEALQLRLGPLRENNLEQDGWRVPTGQYCYPLPCTSLFPVLGQDGIQFPGRDAEVKAISLSRATHGIQMMNSVRLD